MLTVEQCRNELKKHDKELTNEEVRKIRDFFYEMSKLVDKTINTNQNEKGHIVR